MNKTVIGFIVVAALAGVAWLALGHSPYVREIGWQNGSAGKEGRADPGNASIGASATRASAVGSKEYEPYRVLNSGGSLVSALANYQPGDPRIGDLVSMGSYICSQDPDPSGLVTLAAGDPSRSWAVDRVLKICEGFDASQYKLAPATGDFSQTLQKQGAEAARAEAMASVGTAPNQMAIAMAGQYLLEQGQIPLDGIVPGWKDEYGRSELVSAWVHASTLVVCNEGGGCGPDSLSTASFCMNTGCKPGSDIGSAYRDRLSAAEYRAMMAFYAWIIQQRQTRH